ncbi:metal-binding protein ZinT [Cytobacillus purgationiresistens]|uniref:Zinc transport system substrate-binding protein n=1 Tax=Cytobacillus purgationiresistens TaxID=863449 RepID=A0ABU0AMV5_9BACI|nr:metal-binding protein ZinT [Cytobacillus purgationiresistens]MDQ0271713.1 zinc transport system substrate-binding protein [Cytobacillus purgationiresistens]
MKKELIKAIVGFSLLGAILAGCQEKEATPIENASSDYESTESTDHAHNHSHDHSHDAEKQQEIYSGIFEDDEIEDRELTDWEGDWQSVYSYLLDGSLDEVLQKKVETNKDKTFEEYREYYTVGYDTEIERIVIEDNTMTFYKNGEGKTGEYRYHGYETLSYESGNRGVRYLFNLVGEVNGVPKHVQFSDHGIYPTEAEHYHIYFGDEEHDTLLNRLDNWPTYYPSNLNGEEIAEEMNAH